MNPIVEFCLSNMAKGGDYVFNQLEKMTQMSMC